MKYIIQVFKEEINGHEEKEGLPTEYQYEFEQEMLEHFHDLKNDLREKGWLERETPEVSQTSFLRSENSDGQLVFDYEKSEGLINVPQNIYIFAVAFNAAESSNA